MTSPLAPTWRPITKRVLDLFGRWGDPRTNLRSMLDSVIPVAVVDRFRDDDEGSIFGIQAFAQGRSNEFPSISFGSAVNDWELLQITFLQVVFNVGLPRTILFHMFTPIAPYNPALNPAPVGVFINGLLTNRDFNFGTVTGIGGYNPALPINRGPSLQGPFTLINPARSVPVSDLEEGSMTRPIRVYRDTTLTIQFIGTNTGSLDMDCNILYRERPKVSQ